MSKPDSGSRSELVGPFQLGPGQSVVPSAAAYSRRQVRRRPPHHNRPQRWAAGPSSRLLAQSLTQPIVSSGFGIAEYTTNSA